MTYDFKALSEIGWAVLVAVVVQAAQIIVSSNLETVTDWRTWFVSLAAACARAGLAIIVAKLTAPKPQGE